MSAALRLVTESGSVYEVDGLNVRRVVRSAASDAERVSGEWRRAVRVDWRLGESLRILWGAGTDEHSPGFVRVAVAHGLTAWRLTVTSPVASSEIIGVPS